MPESARGVFSSRELSLCEQYVAWLADAGVVRGLIGPREAPRLWERHIVNCALPAPLLPGTGEVCDVGSGAGLPGVVLAIVRPELSFTLVEPLLRRADFLVELVEDLGLGNVEVIRDRAENLHDVRHFDVVCSRAVAPLDRLVGWCLPLCRPGGHVMALKGRRAHDEVAECADALAAVGAGTATVEELEPPDGSEPTFVVTIPWGDPRRVHLASDRKAPSGSGSRSSSKRKSRRSQ